MTLCFELSKNRENIEGKRSFGNFIRILIISTHFYLSQNSNLHENFHVSRKESISKYAFLLVYSTYLFSIKTLIGLDYCTRFRQSISVKYRLMVIRQYTIVIVGKSRLKSFPGWSHYSRERRRLRLQRRKTNKRSPHRSTSTYRYSRTGSSIFRTKYTFSITSRHVYGM